MRLLSFDTLFCSIEILKKKKSCDFLQLKLFATISWVQSDIAFMGFPCSVLNFSV